MTTDWDAYESQKEQEMTEGWEITGEEAKPTEHFCTRCGCSEYAHTGEGGACITENCDCKEFIKE